MNANALRWDGRPGRYEVWYLTVAGRFWIRYSLRVPSDPDEEGEAALWLADFTGTPRALKATFPLEALRTPGEGWPLELGPGRLGDTEASGEIDGARWRLTFSAGQKPFVYTPPVMSRLGLASTEVVVVKPSLAISGIDRARRRRDTSWMRLRASRRTSSGGATPTAGAGSTRRLRTAAGSRGSRRRSRTCRRSRCTRRSTAPPMV